MKDGIGTVQRAKHIEHFRYPVKVLITSKVDLKPGTCRMIGRDLSYIATTQIWPKEGVSRRPIKTVNEASPS